MDIVPRSVPTFVFALIAFGARVSAQTTPVPPEQETLVLSPFEVVAENDNSYGALNSNSITRFNTPLVSMPVSADVMSAEFMRDVATTTIEELMQNYGAGAGTVVASPESDSNANQPGDRFANAQNGIRGLSAGVTRRDGFLAASTSTVATDSFDVERVEVIRGPQGLLYGASGAGGIVNTVSKQARFNKREGRVTLRLDQYGSTRTEFDYNFGAKSIAARISLLDEKQTLRRKFLNNDTEGGYLQLAARLPLNTTVRLSARRTDNSRIYGGGTTDLSFTNNTRDPRHQFSPAYLLATNQAGAVNPKTGAPYPAGPIVNGLLDWENYKSFGGWERGEWIDTYSITGTVDTVWRPWLSTQFGALFDHRRRLYRPDGGDILAPNAFNTSNTLNEWATQASYRIDDDSSRRIALRGAVLLTNELFSRRAKSQTVFGYDADFVGSGRVSYRYYLADANGNVAYNPGAPGTDALGRTQMANLQWSIANGPIDYKVRPGARFITRDDDGRTYVLTQQNPRSAAWASPTNPLGLASLGVSTTISGDNFGGYEQEDEYAGLFIANSTNFFSDRLNTLLGWRRTRRFERDPNTSITGTQAYEEIHQSNNSFNAGLNYKINSWLHAYYSVSQTFEPPKGGNDVMGNAPDTVEGFGQEAGFKFAAGERVSGSVAYYMAKSKNESFRYGSFFQDTVNPNALNGRANGPGGISDRYITLDKESSGLEVILTASPTRNWRMRFAATMQDGKVNSEVRYPLLWNDEFYRDSSGGVTYSNGAPFMVPTDAAGIAAVSRLTRESAPVTGASMTQLTVGMLSDPSSDYYAYGKNGPQSVNGRIVNNSIAYRALRWFAPTANGQVVRAITGRTGLPVSEIPYAFNDPAGLKGTLLVAERGEPTIGHPLYRVNFTTNYRFSEGWIRGLSLGGSVNLAYKNRTYYYLEPDGKGGNNRFLFRAPIPNPQINAIASYQRKLGKKFLFRTQLNVNNVFNRYVVGLTPSEATGYTLEQNVDATFYGQPRLYVWTNSLEF